MHGPSIIPETLLLCSLKFKVYHQQNFLDSQNLLWLLPYSLAPSETTEHPLKMMLSSQFCPVTDFSSPRALYFWAFGWASSPLCLSFLLPEHSVSSPSLPHPRFESYLFSQNPTNPPCCSHLSIHQSFPLDSQRLIVTLSKSTLL